MLTLVHLCFPTSPEDGTAGRSPSLSAARSPSCQHDFPEAQDVCKSVHQFLASLEGVEEIVRNSF